MLMGQHLFPAGDQLIKWAGLLHESARLTIEGVRFETYTFGWSPVKTMTALARNPVRRTLAVLWLALLTVLTTGVSYGGILSDADLKRIEGLRPLFESLMSDLVQASKRPDLPSGDASCINNTIQELLQISNELASYEYLIGMDKEIAAFDEKNPMRDLIRFAADKSGAILATERKRLVQLSDQCARFPAATAKNQETLQVLDTTSGILASIRDRL